MASEAMMIAEYERRSALFPARSYDKSVAWWEPVNADLRAHMRYVVTVPRSDRGEFTHGIPLATETIDWLLDNIGPEATTGYNDAHKSAFAWKVGGWDWFWTPNQSNEDLDILFLDPTDAVAFKVRWA